MLTEIDRRFALNLMNSFAPNMDSFVDQFVDSLLAPPLFAVDKEEQVRKRHPYQRFLIEARSLSMSFKGAKRRQMLDYIDWLTSRLKSRLAVKNSFFLWDSVFTAPGIHSHIDVDSYFLRRRTGLSLARSRYDWCEAKSVSRWQKKPRTKVTKYFVFCPCHAEVVSFEIGSQMFELLSCLNRQRDVENLIKVLSRRQRTYKGWGTPVKDLLWRCLDVGFVAIMRKPGFDATAL